MHRRSADGLRYSIAAAKQYRAQLARYADAAAGLDMLFAAAVRQTEILAIGNPEGFARVFDDSDLHVIVVRRFPFKLFYVVRNNVVVVARLAHTARSVKARVNRKS